MARKQRKQVKDEKVNMTPMIDIVFQMIIFFVCTADMDRKSFDEKIKLAMSPNAAAVTKKDPRTVTIEVDRKGRMEVSRTFFDRKVLLGILRKAVADYGQTTPVVIRGDGLARHKDIRTVMDTCSEAGLWKVKFAATKEVGAERK